MLENLGENVRNMCYLFYLIFKMCIDFRERERDRERQRERETQRLKQAPGSELSAQTEPDAGVEPMNLEIMT